MRHYATLQDVQRRHRRGWTAKHCPLALIEPGAAEYYTWHRKEYMAWRELKQGRRMAGDERVIRIAETDLYRAERQRILSLRRERRRIRESGRRLPGTSSSVVGS